MHLEFMLFNTLTNI